ncbi:EAL domain-containing protein [Luteimonas huabeiensis]|uniref:EAL domain-containing protein n=1 Tax=Luteimonas huabeiensis TaxID=1244513 RepID=UPI000466844F|nr:EAL domain-containing protein [Luteimonas huabeiensis]
MRHPEQAADRRDTGDTASRQRTSGLETAAHRRDRTLAAELLDDLIHRRLVLAFQPVRRLAAADASACLYEEALLRRAGERDDAPAEAIRALERQGAIAQLDRSVLWSVIQTLARHPGQCLGANISAASLRAEAWWQAPLRYLGAHPRVARRLTVEITETAPVRHPIEALSLIAGLQARGVRVALDDLGAGHATLAFLARSRADLAKIDRSVLFRPPDALRELVRACADHCPCVVVEGIESEADLAAARHAGAHAAQGFHVGRPTTTPPWLTGPAVTVSPVEPASCPQPR